MKAFQHLKNRLISSEKLFVELVAEIIVKTNLFADYEGPIYQFLEKTFSNILHKSAGCMC